MRHEFRELVEELVKEKLNTEESEYISQSSIAYPLGEKKNVPP